MIKVDMELGKRLRALGVSNLNNGPFMLPDKCVFEPPCSIKWMSVQHSLAIGAFSYAVSGYYFGAAIGRYVSIGESVQIGRGSHPVDWASTSPMFYQRHQDAVDITIPEAEGFSTTAPHISARQTVIGNDVYIGHGAFIMQGVKIGDGAVIGACSVVTKDVPAFAIAAGSPASVRKIRFPDKIIERMIRIEWWKYPFWELKGAEVADPNRFLDFVEKRIADGLQPYAPALIRLKDVAR